VCEFLHVIAPLVTNASTPLCRVSGFDDNSGIRLYLLAKLHHLLK
jgi:hypothetical protein